MLIKTEIKMNKSIHFFLVISLLLSVAGCKSYAPKYGHYTGRNPDVSFDLVEENPGEDAYALIENFIIILPPIKFGDEFYPDSDRCPWMGVKSDGSFSCEGKDLTGKIESDVVSGHDSGYRYSVESRINGYLIKSIELDTPAHFDINWSATFGGTLPTDTPFPTAIPPKLGHYEGTDVSFDITTSGVENFNSTLGVSANFGCVVHSEPVLEINKYGLFSVTDTSQVSLTGVINGDTVVGNYGFTGTCAVYCAPGNICSYDPNISYWDVWSAKWVSP
jgi:hypothetical protein